MENNVWIRLTFITASQLKGQNELVEKLKEICIVQTPKKHLPAFCSGFEFFAELYINVSLEDFVKNVVITGLAWDGTKAALVKIWKSFKGFVERNHNSFDLQRLQLCFNDAVIMVNGVDSYRFPVTVVSESTTSFGYSAERRIGRNFYDCTSLCGEKGWRYWQNDNGYSKF